MSSYSSQFRALPLIRRSNEGTSRPQDEDEDNNCGCDKPAVERTSWTKKPRSPVLELQELTGKLRKPNLCTKGKKCKFFLWKDEELYDKYYKCKLLEMKVQLDKKDNQSEVVTLKKKIVELELMMTQDREDYAQMSGDINKKIWWLKKLYFYIFVAFMCCLVMVLK